MFGTLGRFLCQNISKNINIPMRYSLAKLNMCLLQIMHFYYNRVNKNKCLAPFSCFLLNIYTAFKTKLLFTTNSYKDN